MSKPTNKQAQQQHNQTITSLTRATIKNNEREQEYRQLSML